MWRSNSLPVRRLLVLLPFGLTLLQAVPGAMLFLMLLPAGLWGLASVSDLGDMGPLAGVLGLLLFRCLLLAAANVVLWRSALHVGESERRTRGRTVFYGIAAPASLLVVCRFLWVAFGFLRL